MRGVWLPKFFGYHKIQIFNGMLVLEQVAHIDILTFNVYRSVRSTTNTYKQQLEFKIKLDFKICVSFLSNSIILVICEELRNTQVHPLFSFWLWIILRTKVKSNKRIVRSESENLENIQSHLEAFRFFNIWRFIYA